MAELPTGSVVAGCRVEAVAGRGGMGVVYRATQLSLERPVALKAIAPELAGDATFRERFKRESLLAASIEHPNVIPVYEAGEGEGVLYLIMRYVEGTDLRALIEAEGALEPERATRIVAQVAAALAAAHRRGLIHRDVKPANVLIDSGGESDHAYLTDFGIARHAAATSGLTHTGAVVGTLDYLAPERIQAQGGDGRADIYALGCVLFQTLTGSIPYARDNEAAKMFAHLSAPLPSVRELSPDVPEQLDELARRAMAKDPEDRFATAGEMTQALTGMLPGRPARPPAPLPMPPAEKTREARTREAKTREPARPERSEEPPATAAPSAPGRRRSLVLAAAGAAVAATAVVLALSLSGGGEGSPDRTTDRPLDRPSGQPLSFDVAGVTRLEPGPDGIAVDSGTVWVANKQTDQVVPVEEAGGAAQDAIPVGANPDSVAVGFGSVWVTNTDDGDVSRIDLESRTTTRRIDVGDGPEGIAVSEEAVWVANGRAGSVTRIPAEGGTPTTEEAGAGPIQIAVTGDDRIWVTLSGADRVVELDRDSGRPIGPGARVRGQPRGIAFDGERLWVAATSGGYLAVFRPDEPGQVAEVRGIRGPREVRFGLGAIWVTTGSSERLVAIDPSTREQVRSFSIGPLAYGLAVSDSFAWAASEGTGRLVKVGPQG